MERQEGGSLIWFLFIIGALWQSADLLFYAVRLQTLSRQLADNIFFLFRKCVLNGFSVWGFLWIEFCSTLDLVSFHLEFGRRGVVNENSSFMYFSLHTEEREIMTSCETNTLRTEILMCLNVFYYDTIYFYIFFLLFSIYRTTTNNL